MRKLEQRSGVATALRFAIDAPSEGGVFVFGLLSRRMWQRLPRPPFVRDLAARSVPRNSRLISIGAVGDIVVPPLFTRLPRRRGHRDVQLDGATHRDLLHHPDVLDRVRAALAA